MAYRVTTRLTNKSGEVIATAGSLIEIEDLPAPNRASVAWLIEQGYLVEEAQPVTPDPKPNPLSQETTPKSKRGKE